MNCFNNKRDRKINCSYTIIREDAATSRNGKETFSEAHTYSLRIMTPCSKVLGYRINFCIGHECSSSHPLKYFLKYCIYPFRSQIFFIRTSGLEEYFELSQEYITAQRVHLRFKPLFHNATKIPRLAR